jgi:hypothetical protein
VAAAVLLAAAVVALVWPRSDALPSAAPAQPTPASAESPPSVPPVATPSDDTPRQPAVRPRAARWLHVLNRLDKRRATAFARGEPHLLATVYAARSAALDADRATLAAYRSEGLQLTGLRMRVLALQVVRAGPQRVVLHVVDRLDPVSAVDAEGRLADLPTDRPSARRIVLREHDSGWRIAAVGPPPVLSRAR